MSCARWMSRGRPQLIGVVLAAGLLAGCGPIGTVGPEVPGSEAYCLALLDETLALGVSFSEFEADPAAADIDTFCRFFANFITLIDTGCIDEAELDNSELPEGTTRASLVEYRDQLECPAM